MARVRPSIGGTLVCIVPCRDMCDMDRGVASSTVSRGLGTSPMTRFPDLAW